jgi:hypothetical protein
MSDSIIPVSQLLSSWGMNSDGTCPDPIGSTIPVSQLLSIYGISPTATATETPPRRCLVNL